MSKSSINTIVISDNAESSSMLKKALASTDYIIVFESANLHQQQLSSSWLIEPDLLVVIVDDVDDSLLSQVHKIYQKYPLPIVVFTKSDSEEAIGSAIDAGISCYIVDGLYEHRVLSILKTACARYQQQEKLVKKINELTVTLAERKVIDRAKGLIMEQRQCSEAEAYKLLRTSAMNQNIRLATLAQNIIDAAVLLSK